MGKRFGRNQRRHYREALLDITAIAEDWRSKAADWRDRSAEQHAKRNALEREVQEWGARILRHTREDGVFRRHLFELGIDGKMAEYLADGNPMNRMPALQDYRGYKMPSELTVDVVRAFATYLSARDEPYPHPGVLFLCKTPNEKFFFMADEESFRKELAQHSGGELGRYIHHQLVKAIKDHAAGRSTARPARSAPPR